MLKEEEYIHMDATELAQQIKNKHLKESEVMEAFQKRLDKVNPQINAVVRTRMERLKKETAVPNGFFAGVPFLTKDISQAVQGEMLTAGSHLLNDTAAQDSHLTAAFRKAGLRIAGQTNTPEFGLKNITEPERYGPSRNPHDLSFSPGGSSGGSTAAVAAGIVPIAGASDGGGSIRIPASFTGLTGLKPTRGRTPSGPGNGRQWQGAAIDFAVSRTVRDSTYLLKEVQTFQREAAFPFPEIISSDFDFFQKELPKRRIAFSYLSPAGTPVSADAKKTLKETVLFLESEGHEITEAAPDIDGKELMRQYYLMNCGEMASVVSQLEAAKGSMISAEDLELESWMLQEAGRTVTAAAYSQSLQAWDLASIIMHEFHQRYDFFLTPATATSAPRVGELTHSTETAVHFRERMLRAPVEAKQDLIYEMFLPSLTYTPFTQLANLTGQPAVSMPLGETENHMPIGVQAMAAKGEEIMLLHLAAVMERSPLWKQKSLM